MSIARDSYVPVHTEVHSTPAIRTFFPRRKVEKASTLLTDLSGNTMYKYIKNVELVIGHTTHVVCFVNMYIVFIYLDWYQIN